MGGSGSGVFSGNWDPDELARRARAAEDRARSDEFDTAVSDYLGSLLGEYNSRDAHGIQRLLEEVTDDLKEYIDGVDTTLFGGSVSRHTYLEGISDVDAMILFDNQKLEGKGPVELKAILAQSLRDRFGRDAVKIGTLAVTCETEAGTIQLLPALRSGDGFRISSTDGTTWARISPRRFAAALTRHNQRLQRKLVPCIKLIKGIMARLPESRRLTGYHTEALAISVFRRYSGECTTKTMLRFFFRRASAHVLRPIRDSSGQSIHVDEYLGEAKSTRRRIMANTLDVIGRRIRNADGAESRQRWQDLFE